MITKAAVLVACMGLIISVTAGAPSAALSAARSLSQDLLVRDEKSQPESLAIASDGTLFVGSAGSPYVYRLKNGTETAEVFVDASIEGAGTFFLGQLVDGETLWTCLLTPMDGGAAHKSSLRAYDVKTGVEKFRWQLPGATTACNDFSVGPDKALYVTDTLGAKIYRLAPGVKTPELFSDNMVLGGVDGITFLDGVLYVNSVIFNNLYRIPIDAAGKAGIPVEIWIDAPALGLDGMRSTDGKLIVAENASGKITALTVKGDVAHATTLKGDLKAPTAVEPDGKTIWYTERGTGKVRSLQLPN